MAGGGKEKSKKKNPYRASTTKWPRRVKRKTVRLLYKRRSIISGEGHLGEEATRK